MFNNELDKLEKIPIVLNPNITKIPITRLPMSYDGVEEFNRIYFLLKSYCKNFNKIEWTKKHYIKRSGKSFRLPLWDVSAKGSGVEITVLCIEGMFRVHLKTGFLTQNALEQKTNGYVAFLKFREICEKHGINIEDYAIDNGEEVKQTIDKAPRKLYKDIYAGMIFENVHHIDLNSSYMSGVMSQYPELAAPIKDIYATRKKAKAEKNKEKDRLYKAVLTNTWGYFQSHYAGYRFSHLSKAGIDFNNNLLEKITNKLKSQGFIILSYNTDGIWYTHPKGIQYHDEDEGEELCQWKCDHHAKLFQAKHGGSYHFIEEKDGKDIHQVVISGLTNLDSTKPREEWTWEDFSSSGAEVNKIKFDLEKGAYFV